MAQLSGIQHMIIRFFSFCIYSKSRKYYTAGHGVFQLRMICRESSMRNVVVSGQLAPKIIRPGRFAPTGVFYERFNAICSCCLLLTNVSPLC